jgi:hypothetical protein
MPRVLAVTLALLALALLAPAARADPPAAPAVRLEPIVVRGRVHRPSVRILAPRRRPDWRWTLLDGPGLARYERAASISPALSNRP